MADKYKKEPTTAPLLFMSAGGGLTLTPLDQPSLLMPVIQSEPSLIDPDDDGFGEADSFIGQSSPKDGHVIPTTLFQSASIAPNADPVTQTGLSAPFNTTNKYLARYTTVQSVGSKVLVPTANMPLAGSSVTTEPLLPNASGLPGLYMKHGSGRYAQMPSGTYSTSSASFTSTSPAPIPFSPAFTEASLKGTTFTGDLSPESLPPQPSLGQRSDSSFAQQCVGIYVPVAFHWCFCKNVEGRDIWYPFSFADSLALEDAHRAATGGGKERPVVSTDGGRYDVNLIERKRYSVYWDEDPKQVQRCSWFYKREGDNRYVPYDEYLCIRLEEEYKMAVTSGGWHKPIHFNSGETIVMHNQNVMVHYQPSSQPDEWGNVSGDQMRPRVIKRGVSEFESIDDGELRPVDHLVFMVHGIGSVCDIRFRNIIECVDDFRSISQSILSRHFSQYLDSSRIGRVEFLPIQWHKALHGDATGIDKRLKMITLPSTAKLRNFINDTLMDVLFYTSPTYCQCIADTVGNEMNRLYELFLSRNPKFTGSCSVAGHSLGSCIVFDILQHQPDINMSPDLSNAHGQPAALTSQPELTEVVPVGVPHTSDGKETDEETTMTLEELFAKVGLKEKVEVFQQEQIDMESLMLCSESDLKDLSIPMGPRKKLHGILKEELQKKDKRCLEQKRREEVQQKRIQELAVQKQSSHTEEQNDQNRLKSASSTTINYIVGVGGTGHASIQYPKLKFSPVCCFALGSPVGLFLSSRGVEVIGEDFRLPTCQKYFNIFHPAYRLEPLINPNVVHIKPVLIPHHKGRKRLHLELKEGLIRMGMDIKQKIIDSLKSTWATINSFARAHQSEQSLEQQVESEMSSVVRQLEDDERSDTTSITSAEDVYIGQLNEGRRVDYVLQERPIESFNDYMFSLTSHGCYWNSEDTVLLVLKEIYSQYGIFPTMPGTESQSLEQATRVDAPSKGTSFSATHLGTLSAAVSQMPPSTYWQPNMEVNQESSQLYNALHLSQAIPYQTSLPASASLPLGSQAFNVQQTPPFAPASSSGPQPIATSGPPPLKGFVKKS